MAVHTVIAPYRQHGGIVSLEERGLDRIAHSGDLIGLVRYHKTVYQQFITGIHLGERAVGEQVVELKESAVAVQT